MQTLILQDNTLSYVAPGRVQGSHVKREIPGVCHNNCQLMLHGVRGWSGGTTTTRPDWCLVLVVLVLVYLLRIC